MAIFWWHLLLAQAWDLRENWSHVATGQKTVCLSEFHSLEFFAIELSLGMVDAVCAVGWPGNVVLQNQPFLIDDLKSRLC